ncbi:hypothetical protein DVH24_015633 [Malus domestica]|uniref:Uncharacterized protein n=1 Tax=Malus domestica TaxID=3750 RepID=A0A498HPB6_MALDO|nr:hypothetical protein DVH24_015633 [Malus domestica]
MGVLTKSPRLQLASFESSATMEFVPSLGFNIQPGGLPLRVRFAEWRFYGFKPRICALCCMKTLDILQCPEREYFPKHWNHSYSEFYTPSLEKHIEQPNVPQELSVEGKLSKLLESIELHMN